MLIEFCLNKKVFIIIINTELRKLVTSGKETGVRTDEAHRHVNCC
jgi:hypothetical protein